MHGRKNLVIVNNPRDWPLDVPGVEVVSARSYLSDPSWSTLKGVRVFNLCRSYKYQSLGYYVSLIAEARGHRPLPSLTTVLDFKSIIIVRYASDDLDQLIQKSLHSIQADHFTLSIYFGHNVAKRHEALSNALHKAFAAPLMRAQFNRSPEGKWQMQGIRPLAASEISQDLKPFVLEKAIEYFSGDPSRTNARRSSRFDLAILRTPGDQSMPSNDRAIQKFIKAARNLRIDVDVITKDDYARLAEFDGLFIRETTSVNHYTYRFARRAVADGLVVIDDPVSILRCANKVFLAELLTRHKIPVPITLIVHRDNRDEIQSMLGTPCILKQPDSYFSLGVHKVDNPDQLVSEVNRLLEHSDLIIAQEFMPTEFDWRVGIFDQQPLWVCKYHMASKHWQIVKREDDGNKRWGDVDCIPVEFAPREVINTALRAANLIGDGLYGVDLKQVGKKVYVIEVNDNPNIDAGYEDQILKDELYEIILRVFLRRMERRKAGQE